MAQKKKIAEPQPVAELEPVELDPTPKDPADAVLRRISEFEDTLPDSMYDWNKGAPAPEWMGQRPVWAEDYYDSESAFLPSRCFWQSDEIRMPVLDLYGARSDDHRYRTLGGYGIFLRQYARELEPSVVIRVGPKSNRHNLSLTLSEVEDLVAALEMLSDIAKKAASVDANGGAE